MVPALISLPSLTMPSCSVPALSSLSSLLPRGRESLQDIPAGGESLPTNVQDDVPARGLELVHPPPSLSD